MEGVETSSFGTMEEEEEETTAVDEGFEAEVEETVGRRGRVGTEETGRRVGTEETGGRCVADTLELS